MYKIAVIVSLLGVAIYLIASAIERKQKLNNVKKED